MGNWDVSKSDNNGERELIDRAVKALEAELATKTCNKQITSKLEDAELARDSEETCNNKQVISKLIASDDAISRQEVLDMMQMRMSGKELYKAVYELPSVVPKQEQCEDAISRQAAKEAVKRASASGTVQMLLMEILDGMPSVNPMPCEDVISRQALLDTIDRFGYLGKRQLKEVVLGLPPVTPKQRTGHWILRDDINGQYQCDECGMFSGLSKFDVEEAGWKLSNFCSNCGAKMESEEQT